MRLAACVALAALGAACAGPGGPAQVTGSASYRERMALPEGAALRVTLLDISWVDAPERVIAEREVRPAGQPPIPFALDVPPGRIERERRYGLRAAIVGADGRTLWATPAAVPVLTQGAPAAVELWLQRVSAAAPAGPRVVAYDCAGFAFRAELSRERALLLLPGRSLALPSVPSASGAKYSDGTNQLWSKGEEASLRLDGVDYPGCRARARPLP